MCAAHVNLVSSVIPKNLTFCFVSTSRPLNVIGNIWCLSSVDLSGFMRIRRLEVHKTTSFKYVCSWVVASNSTIFDIFFLLPHFDAAKTNIFSDLCNSSIN